MGFFCAAFFGEKEFFKKVFYVGSSGAFMLGGIARLFSFCDSEFDSKSPCSD